MIEFKYDFIDGAFIEIIDQDDILNENEYHVEFIDNDTRELLFEVDLNSNHWARTSVKYFVNWYIKITHNNNIVFEYKLDLSDKNVLIKFDSSSLGDNIAWMPAIEIFRKKYKIKNLYCSTFKNEFFRNIYSNINFIEPNILPDNVSVVYGIGIYDDGKNISYNPTNPFTIPLISIPFDILGLEYDKEYHSEIFYHKTENKIKQKYICIAEHSTAQTKYWNNPNGWAEVVRYLNNEGYLVYSLSREESEIEGVIKPHDLSMDSIINMLEHCEFFIGVSSGISWLSWAMKVKTIMISGFTESFFEFETGNIRIINKSVCHGCFNKPNTFVSFDRSDWNWCPMYKNTEKHFICSKSITSDVVIDKIKMIQNDEYNFDTYVKVEQEEVASTKFNFDEETHLIYFGCTSLGDTIAWIPYCEEYRVKHNVDVHVLISSQYIELFEDSYPDIKFLKIDRKECLLYKYHKRFMLDQYPLNMGEDIYNKFDNYPMVDSRNLPLQLIAPNILGLPMVAKKAKIDIPDVKPNFNFKYVVVAIQSTSQCKYWNYTDGWESVFDYLKKIGYKIVIIDRWKSFGIANYFNEAPRNKAVIDKTGKISLLDRVVDIKNADMMITISSGLSWIANALNIPTIMISGFTKPWNEFSDNIERIHNDNVCNGCWNNTKHNFDEHNWLWCPENKNFECTKSIKPTDIIQSIKKIERETNSIVAPVSVGELVDKITILKIKLSKIKNKAKLVNIRKEFNYLKDIMIKQTNIDEDNDDFLELMEINLDLWDIEDNIRKKEKSKEFDDEFIQLARNVYITNDERSEVKKRINLSNGSYLVEEKSYKKY